MLNGWLLRLMFLPLLFYFNQKEVLDAREPCNLMVLDVTEPCFYFVLVHDVIEPFFVLFLALDVIEPCFVFGSDVIEPIIVDSDVIEPMIVGSGVIEPMIICGFRRYQHLIPDMWQLELANVPVKGWVIHSDEYCFFDVPECTYTMGICAFFSRETYSV